MKKICVLLALAAVAALGLTACGGQVNGDSGGKVSDTMQSTLMGEENSSTELSTEMPPSETPGESDAGSTESKGDENLSEDLSQAITDISDTLDGSKTEAQ